MLPNKQSSLLGKAKASRRSKSSRHSKDRVKPDHPRSLSDQSFSLASNVAGHKRKKRFLSNKKSAKSQGQLRDRAKPARSSTRGKKSQLIIIIPNNQIIQLSRANEVGKWVGYIRLCNVHSKPVWFKVTKTKNCPATIRPIRESLNRHESMIMTITAENENNLQILEQSMIKLLMAECSSQHRDYVQHEEKCLENIEEITLKIKLSTVEQKPPVLPPTFVEKSSRDVRTKMPSKQPESLTSFAKQGKKLPRKGKRRSITPPGARLPALAKEPAKKYPTISGKKRGTITSPFSGGLQHPTTSGKKRRSITPPASKIPALAKEPAKKSYEGRGKSGLLAFEPKDIILLTSSSTDEKIFQGQLKITNVTFICVIYRIRTSATNISCIPNIGCITQGQRKDIKITVDCKTTTEPDVNCAKGKFIYCQACPGEDKDIQCNVGTLIEKISRSGNKLEKHEFILQLTNEKPYLPTTATPTSKMTKLQKQQSNISSKVTAKKKTSLPKSKQMQQNENNIPTRADIQILPAKVIFHHDQDERYAGTDITIKNLSTKDMLFSIIKMESVSSIQLRLKEAEIILIESHTSKSVILEYSFTSGQQEPASNMIVCYFAYSNNKWEEQDFSTQMEIMVQTGKVFIHKVPVEIITTNNTIMDPTPYNGPQLDKLNVPCMTDLQISPPDKLILKETHTAKKENFLEGRIYLKNENKEKAILCKILPLTIDGLNLEQTQPIFLNKEQKQKRTINIKFTAHGSKGTVSNEMACHCIFINDIKPNSYEEAIENAITDKNTYVYRWQLSKPSVPPVTDKQDENVPGTTDFQSSPPDKLILKQASKNGNIWEEKIILKNENKEKSILCKIVPLTFDGLNLKPPPRIIIRNGQKRKINITFTLDGSKGKVSNEMTCHCIFVNNIKPNLYEEAIENAIRDKNTYVHRWQISKQSVPILQPVQPMPPVQPIPPDETPNLYAPKEEIPESNPVADKQDEKIQNLEEKLEKVDKKIQDVFDNLPPAQTPVLASDIPIEKLPEEKVQKPAPRLHKLEIKPDKLLVFQENEADNAYEAEINIYNPSKFPINCQLVLPEEMTSFVEISIEKYTLTIQEKSRQNIVLKCQSVRPLILSEGKEIHIKEQAFGKTIWNEGELTGDAKHKHRILLCEYITSSGILKCRPIEYVVFKPYHENYLATLTISNKSDSAVVFRVESSRTEIVASTSNKLLERNSSVALPFTMTKDVVKSVVNGRVYLRLLEEKVEFNKNSEIDLDQSLQAKRQIFYCFIEDDDLNTSDMVMQIKGCYPKVKSENIYLTMSHRGVQGALLFYRAEEQEEGRATLIIENRTQYTTMFKIQISDDAADVVNMIIGENPRPIQKKSELQLKPQSTKIFALVLFPGVETSWFERQWFTVTETRISENHYSLQSRLHPILIEMKMVKYTVKMLNQLTKLAESRAQRFVEKVYQLQEKSLTRNPMGGSIVLKKHLLEVTNVSGILHLVNDTKYNIACKIIVRPEGILKTSLKHNIFIIAAKNEEIVRITANIDATKQSIEEYCYMELYEALNVSNIDQVNWGNVSCVQVHMYNFLCLIRGAYFGCKSKNLQVEDCQGICTKLLLLGIELEKHLETQKQLTYEFPRPEQITQQIHELKPPSRSWKKIPHPESNGIESLSEEYIHPANISPASALKRKKSADILHNKIENLEIKLEVVNKKMQEVFANLPPAAPPVLVPDIPTASKLQRTAPSLHKQGIRYDRRRSEPWGQEVPKGLKYRKRIRKPKEGILVKHGHKGTNMKMTNIFERIRETVNNFEKKKDDNISSSVMKAIRDAINNFERKRDSIISSSLMEAADKEINAKYSGVDSKLTVASLPDEISQVSEKKHDEAKQEPKEIPINAKYSEVDRNKQVVSLPNGTSKSSEEKHDKAKEEPKEIPIEPHIPVLPVAPVFRPSRLGVAPPDSLPSATTTPVFSSLDEILLGVSTAIIVSSIVFITSCFLTGKYEQ